MTNKNKFNLLISIVNFLPFVSANKDLLQGGDLDDYYITEIGNIGVSQNVSTPVFTLFLMLITGSLILTFYEHATAVTRVFGLLFTSFFVCLLWIYHTSFIFIYLVYILAFISAVLMLFLTVVLMLPISLKN